MGQDHMKVAHTKPRTECGFINSRYTAQATGDTMPKAERIGKPGPIKPLRLHLLEGPAALEFETLIQFFEKVAGRKATPAELDEARRGYDTAKREGKL
jgi:hypothetical protein